MPDAFANRRQRLRRALKQHSVQAGLITNPVNVRYLTGFTGDSSYLLLDQRHELLLSDTRFAAQIAEECPGWDVEIRDASLTIDQLAIKAVEKWRPRSLMVESDHLTKSSYDLLVAGFKSTKVQDSTSLVAALRAIKDRTEIAAIRRSIKVAEDAFRAICAQLDANQTERDVAARLEYEIRTMGGEGCSFPPIVGVGARAALPHGRPGDTKIGASAMVLMDWGATVCGYMSDLTRVISTGKISPKFQRIYSIVRRAQQAAIGRIRPGAKLKTVDAAARSIIADEGFGKYFGHGLGHGFGLEIHELPRLSPAGEGTLEAGMVVTVEPGIYLPGWGGIRIEDDVLVTRDGHEVLTTLPGDLESHQVELGGRAV
jgi:Xaa-Pro aminopeptidase